MDEQKENQGYWACIELFGHQTIAGFIQPADFPAGMVQINVPEIDGYPAWTKIVHVNAIYAVTPTTEQNARAQAHAIKARPKIHWDLLKEINHQKLLFANVDDDDDDDHAF